MCNELDSLIDKIKEDIIYSFPFLKSIYLIGSFGRDEGSFTIDNGNLIIYNDIDFIGIAEDSDRYLISKNEIISFCNSYSKKLNIPFFDFNIYIKSDILTQEPSIQSYDFKYGSKLIYGFDYAKEYKIEISELSNYEFIRLMLNRSAGLLSGIYYNTSKEYNIIQLYKAYIAIGDSLLFYLDRFYDPKYRVRQLEFLEKKDSMLTIIDKVSYNDIIDSYTKKIDCQANYSIESAERVKKLLLQTIYLYQDISIRNSNRHIFYNLLKDYSTIKPNSFIVFIIKNFLKKSTYLPPKMILFLLIFSLNSSKSYLDTMFYKIVLLPFTHNKELEDKVLISLWFKHCH